MKLRIASFLLGAALPLAAAGPVAPPAPAADTASRLAGRALGATPLLADAAELCDRIGGRPTGSPANDRAVSWAVAKLRAAGADSVVTEEFEVPSLWLPGPAEGQVVAPESFPLRLAASPESPATPGGKAIEAPVVDAGEATAEDFARLGAKAKGAIVLVRNREMKTGDDLFAEYLRNAPLSAALARSGAVAMLLESSRPRGLLYRHPVAFAPSLFPVPSAVVSREEFARLERLTAGPAGPAGAEVRVRLLLGSRTGGRYASRNVVAEWKGRERPAEVVLVGAHLDSWELGTGANDNGINVALAIDVLRGMRELGVRPRRTLRVVLFNGEEQGMWGSAGYVKAHAAEMDRHAAVVIFDTGSGRLSGFYLNGRPELKGPVDAALAAASGLGPFDHSPEAIDGTDNFDFLLSGVPNLVGMQDWAPYLPDYHAESDTFDKIDGREARAATAVASALAWGLAESPEPPAKRQTRAEVDALIKGTKLDEQMRPFGQWDDWTSGRRGASR